MGRYAGYAIYTDMDATLLNDEKQITRANREAIGYFVENGGAFSVATGRTEITVREYIDQVAVSAPAILYNGPGVYDFTQERFLHAVYLERDPLDGVIAAMLADFPTACLQVYAPGAAYLANPMGERDAFTERAAYGYRRVEYGYITGPLFKALFFSEDDGMIAAMEPALRARLDPNRYSVTTSSPNYLEILPPHCTKGDALRWIAKEKGYTKTIAIGDFYNDLEMLRAADVAAAVANARPELLQEADVVTADCNHDALADLIFRVLE